MDKPTTTLRIIRRTTCQSSKAAHISLRIIIRTIYQSNNPYTKLGSSLLMEPSNRHTSQPLSHPQACPPKYQASIMTITNCQSWKPVSINLRIIIRTSYQSTLQHPYRNLGSALLNKPSNRNTSQPLSDPQACPPKYQESMPLLLQRKKSIYTQARKKSITIKPPPLSLPCLDHSDFPQPIQYPYNQHKPWQASHISGTPTPRRPMPKWVNPDLPMPLRNPEHQSGPITNQVDPIGLKPIWTKHQSE